MATTSIWAVKSRMDHVLDYAKNEDKTRNNAWSEVDYQTMRDVMDYAMNDAKTEKQYYVSGWNCDPYAAREEMQITKQEFKKEDGILAFHGYQSFKPGEVTPQIAHEIGIKLAEELWPDHQVVIATHLDKEHIHSHFVVNSVSLDGRKFNSTKASYRQMRAASDRLCKEYGLSVITEHQEYYPKHYAEWDAEQNGQPTWRSSIKVDMDDAIKYSMTFQQFISEMKKKGYVLERRGSFLRIKAPGMQRFVRLRSLGAGYSEEAIQRRILRHRYPEVPPRKKVPHPRKVVFHGDFRLQKITWKVAIIIKRKSLFKVDSSILVLGAFYIVVMAAYLFFEFYVVNYRPVLINGFLEASYPSSTTLLVMCVMPTAVMQLNSRIRNTKMKRAFAFALIAFTAFMVIGRLISGVHWITDIIGGAILSAGLVMIYYSVTTLIARQER